MYCLVARIQTELTLGVISSAILFFGKVLAATIKIYSHRKILNQERKKRKTMVPAFKKTQGPTSALSRERP